MPTPSDTRGSNGPQLRPWRPDESFFRDFPLLARDGTNWKHTSDASPRYNCVAFAADDESHLWWPTAGAPVVWPEGCAPEATLDSFLCAFSSIGYEICPSDDYDPSQDKVAIFHDQHEPTHAAKQLADGSGWWQSKLGESVDITHELHAVSGGIYGSVRLVMARARAGA